VPSRFLSCSYLNRDSFVEGCIDIAPLAPDGVRQALTRPKGARVSYSTFGSADSSSVRLL